MDKTYKISRFKTLKGVWWSNILARGYNALCGLGGGQERAFIHNLCGILAALSVLAGCSTIRYVPTNTETVINYIDSLVYHIDTVEVQIPREAERNYAGLLDTLRLESSVAEAWCAADTTDWTLKGELKNKEGALKKEVLWKERVVYRDSIQIKEIPIEVPVPEKYVPTIYKYSLGFSIGFLLLLVLWILRKLKVF